MAYSKSGAYSILNSTIVPLNTGATFTGSSEPCWPYPSIILSAITDQIGLLILEFSMNNINWDSSIVYNLVPNLNEVHRVSVTRPYFRVKITNTSGANQTYLRVSCLLGSQTQLTSGLNAQIQLDSDSAIVKTLSDELILAQGLVEGTMIYNKLGRNSDIDSGSITEDLWDGGGIYSGFPITGPEEFQVFSSSAGDNGILTFSYLASTSSTSYQTGTVTLNGTTPVNTGIVGYRIHTAQYISGNATGFNLGNITIRHRTTTTNVFTILQIGRSQTTSSGFTIPANNIGYIRRLFCKVFSNTAGSVEGYLWVRELNGSPRLRRPFSVANTEEYEELPYGGLAVQGGTDIILRITNSFANNLDVTGGFDIITVKTI